MSKGYALSRRGPEGYHRYLVPTFFAPVPTSC